MLIRSTALAASRAVLRALVVLNIFFALVFAVLLGLSAICEDQVLAAMAGNEFGTPAEVMRAGRWVVALALVSAPLAHVLLTRLLAIVETVGAGTPFVAGNARRLQTIAWVLLALQLVDLAYGVLVFSLKPASDLLAWSFSFTGWLAVLLLFVLAGVFREGARMSEDLEGTV